MAIRFELVGTDLHLCIGETVQTRSLQPEDFTVLANLATQYDSCLRTCGSLRGDELVTIGTALFEWLDGDQGWMEDIEEENAPILAYFCSRKRKTLSPEEMIFLSAPWELIYDEKRFWAHDPNIVWCPVRRLGKAKGTLPVSEYALSLAFMAAAPDSQTVLNFEKEEQGILEATKDTPLDLVVEESGTLEGLIDLASTYKPLDVLHVSCHGGKKPPTLYLETDIGEKDLVSATDFSTQLGSNRPKLLFTSACLSAVKGSGDNDDDLPALSHALVQAGFPAVLGWAGSVYDHEASLFAKHVYAKLATKQSLESAIAYGRLNLVLETNKNGSASRDWHLARLFLGASGGGVLSEGAMQRRPIHRDHGHKEFLDTKGEQVPVASREEFVGRRRQIQTILRTYKDKKYAGVLVHGEGRRGKSSLAARIGHRLQGHTIAVVLNRYDALAIIDAVGKSGLKGVVAWAEKHKAVVRDNPVAFHEALQELLGEICPQDKPLYLVIDDFEQVLDKPKTDDRFHVVKHAVSHDIATVIQAFQTAASQNLPSCLLITSRYEFHCVDRSGADVASQLVTVSLPPMDEVDGRKQVRAKDAVLLREDAVLPLGEALQNRILQAGQGNPGLIDLLTSIACEDIKALETAFHALQDYADSGNVPESGQVAEFLEGLLLENMVALLREDEREALRAATLFEIPVPSVAMTECFLATGMNTTDPGASRLRAFGLLDTFRDSVQPTSMAYAVAPLARPLAGTVSEEEASSLAQQIVPALFAAWGDKDDSKRSPQVNIELLRLAVLADNAEVVQVTANDALGWLADKDLYTIGAPLSRKAEAVLQRHGISLTSAQARRAGDLLQGAGEVHEAQRLFQHGIDLLPTKTSPDYDLDLHISLLRRLADVRNKTGGVDTALDEYQTCLRLLPQKGSERLHALLQGDIARIYVSKGRVDEALSLHE
ncbi:CHAT domain-containing protein, partial [Desulfovibrio inopinatus]|uniref:CHAT domain-containing protein n=1 Tax=Desulfovibrio inopinatus TaxID=102109 RepID=UPI00055133F8